MASTTKNSKKRKQAGDGDDDDEQQGAQDNATISKWIVVTKTYPTTYGCNQGRSYSMADMIRLGDVETSDEKYDSREEAVEAAREALKYNCFFEDLNFDEDDEPPFDSADAQNYDNDEEVIIDVMTVEDFAETQQENEQTVRLAGAQRKFEYEVQRRMRGSQALAAGKVFYPTHPSWSNGVTIPAQLEITEQPLDSFGSLSTLQSLKYEPSSDEVEHNADDCTFFKVLKAATSLKELHIHMKEGSSTEFLEKLAEKAPHLKETLQVLSIQNCKLSPETVASLGKLHCESLGELHSLQHLDIANCLENDLIMSIQHRDPYLDSDDDDEEEDDKKDPYKPAFYDLVDALQDLKRLDLGYYESDDEDPLGILETLVGVQALENMHSVMKNRTGRPDDADVMGVTRFRVREPAPWSDTADKDEAERAVLTELAASMTGEDADIAALAKQELEYFI